MKITQTDKEIIITIDKHCDDDYEGFKGLVQLGLKCDAYVYNLCNELNRAMIKLDPKEQIAAHWSEMLTKFTGTSIDQMVIIYNSELTELISNFYKQIGEAMGPVSYAGYELRRYFKENEPDNVSYQDWVDDCIYYYEHYKEN